MTSKFLLIALFAPLLFGRDKTPLPKPDVSIPAGFRNQPAGSARQPASTEWWKAFHDPLLDELVARASSANLDIRVAAARLAAAEASRKSSRSALLPDIDGSTSESRLRGGLNQGIIHAGGAPGGGSFVSPFETSLLSAGFAMRWELDLFGGLRKSLKAAAADADAAASAVADMRLLVRAEVARNYIEMRGIEQQIAIVQANFGTEKQMLDLIRSRAEAGLATDLDIERQVAQLASLHAALPDLDTQRLAAAHRLSVLVSDDPAALEDRFSAPSVQLETPAVPLAVPSEVLKHRPDLRRAQAQIDAAYLRAGAARADLYPKFVITGLSGRQATDLSGLTLGGGNFFSVGPGITLPIFNAGRIRANIQMQDARLTESVRTYEQEILAAFEETENAFVQRDRAERRKRDLETSLAAAKNSVDLSQDLYLHGLADFLTVLDAQRQQFQAERDLAACQTALLRSTVALFKALGIELN